MDKKEALVEKKKEEALKKVREKHRKRCEERERIIKSTPKKPVFLEKYKNADELIYLSEKKKKDYADYFLKSIKENPKSKVQIMNRILISVANLDEYGCSKTIQVEDLHDIEKLCNSDCTLYKTENGLYWLRSDGDTCNRYNVLRGSKGSRTGYLRFNGINKDRKYKATPPSSIKNHFKDIPCYISGKKLSDGAHLDHKNGRYNDKRLGDASLLKISDFQVLFSEINTAKREACKKCLNTGVRYCDPLCDMGFYEGSMEYKGTCVGCKYYDIELYEKKLAEFEVKEALSKAKSE